MEAQMPDAGEGTSTSLVQDIANAPGVPAAATVEERYATLERQFRHDNTIAPLAPAPGEAVRVTATSGSGIPLAAATLYYTVDGSLPSVQSNVLEMDIAQVTWDPRIGYLTHWEAEIPGQAADTIVRYRVAGRRIGSGQSKPDLWAHDGSGFWYRFLGAEGITTFAYPVEPPHAPMPAWMDDAVIYQIFLDRFHPGTDDGTFTSDRSPRGRHGGTLAGVRKSLSHIASLGCTCIWLSPLHPAETHHRYDTLDYFDVDPVLGTREEFRALVAEAHALDIRVLMDFVPSHSSWHHPAFVAAQKDRSAPTASWYTFTNWPKGYRSFLGRAPYLPSFNTDDPGARAHLIEAAGYWVREFGIDGYRLDHAIAPSGDFWVHFNTALKEISPDVVTIAEATDTPECLRRYRGKLDSVLDFELAAALRLTFGRGDWGVGALDSFVTAYERFMSDGPGRVSFLDNHDMDRFLWVARNDPSRLCLAALCQFTLHATPIVYYGTEIGMTQEHGADEIGYGGDAEARHDMPWDRSHWNRELLDFYQRLIAARRAFPLLTRGARRTIHVDDAAGTWVYLRTAGSLPTAGDLLVAFNLGERSATIPLPGSHALSPVLDTGTAPEVRGRDALVLSPRSGALLALE